MLIAMAQKMILAKDGYNITHVTTGEKALALINNGEQFELILSDINLGDGLDGPETAKAILKTQDIPIVFMSSHTEKEVVDKVESITNYGYVIKNSGEFVLVQALKGALRLFAANQLIMHELTERKLVEAEILEKEKRYRILFEQSKDAIFFVDTVTGNYLDANRAAEVLTGRSLSEIKKLKTQDLSPKTSTGTH